MCGLSCTTTSRKASSGEVPCNSLSISSPRTNILDQRIALPSSALFAPVLGQPIGQCFHCSRVERNTAALRRQLTKQGGGIVPLPIREELEEIDVKS